MAQLMTRNTEIHTEPETQTASEELFAKQLESLTQFAIDYMNGQEDEATYDQAVTLFQQNCLGVSKFAKKSYMDPKIGLRKRLATLKPSLSKAFSETYH